MRRKIRGLAMQTFDTSYGNDKISFKIFFDEIIITNIPLILQSNPFLFVVSDAKDEKIINKKVTWNRKANIKIGILNDGFYYINLYAQTNSKTDIYWAYLQNRSLTLLVKDRTMHFVTSPIINGNRKILSNILITSITLERYLRPSVLCQSNSTQITSLAKRITQCHALPMQKLIAIHDWVANNIYYDYDALNTEICNDRSYSALDVLMTKRCVCRGFSNLGVALMRAVGIPAIGLSCYSLNITTDGGWERTENQVETPNHIITAAYINGRWVLMDITWDSDNKYENECYTKRNGEGVSRKYFDTTLEMISNTHKFLYIQDA